MKSIGIFLFYWDDNSWLLNIQSWIGPKKKTNIL
jgi:hypothetical protein